MDALWYIVLIVEQVARANTLSTFATFEINKLHSKLVILYTYTYAMYPSVKDALGNVSDISLIFLMLEMQFCIG